MLTLGIAASLIMILGAGALVHAVKHVQEGYEDTKGFHPVNSRLAVAIVPMAGRSDEPRHPAVRDGSVARDYAPRPTGIIST